MDSDSDDGPSRSPAGSPKRGFSSPKSDDEQKQEETRIEVQIPKINTNLGDNIHFVRSVRVGFSTRKILKPYVSAEKSYVFLVFQISCQ